MKTIAISTIDFAQFLQMLFDAALLAIGAQPFQVASKLVPGLRVLFCVLRFQQEIAIRPVSVALSRSDNNTCASNHRPVVLYFDYAFVHRLNGADARVIGLIEFLLECGCNLIVYSYSNHVDCPWGPEEVELFRARYPNVELVLDQRPVVFDVWKRAKKLLSMLFPAATKTLVRARLPGVMPNYTRLNAQVPNAVWFVSYANGLVELNGVTSWTTIIETHDIDFLIFHKIFGHSLTSFRIIGRWRSEFALLGLASALIAIAAPEAGLFRLCFPEKPVFFIPDYSSAGLLETPIEPRLMDCDVVFVGSDNTFNVDGLCAFI